MSRILLIVLAFVLPIQFAWAGATAYCGHEAGVVRGAAHDAAPVGVAGAAAQVRHYGHHEHAHRNEETAGAPISDSVAGQQSAADKQLGADKQIAAEKQPVADTDCGTCHAAAMQLLPSQATMIVAPILRLRPAWPGMSRWPSAPQGAPYRPSWTRLAEPGETRAA